MSKIIDLNSLIEFYKKAYFPMADSKYSEEIKFYKIILDTYIELHKIGKCHSVECYEDDNLIGGLYGLHIGSCFFWRKHV